MQKQCSSPSHWKLFKFHTVKLKKLTNETTSEMRKDTQRDNAYSGKKKEKKNKK